MKPKFFKLTFTDCGEEYEIKLRAHDCEHAEEKFWDLLLQEGDAGVQLISIKRISLDTGQN